MITEVTRKMMKDVFVELINVDVARRKKCPFQCKDRIFENLVGEEEKLGFV